MKFFTAPIAALAFAALALTMLAGQPAAAAEKASHPKTAAGMEAVNRGDYKTAYQMFRAQAAKGDAEAQFELGMLFALGKGVERNLITAWMWTEIAARQNEPYADFIRDEVAANLNEGDINQARSRANAWMRENGYLALLPAVKKRR